MRRAQQVVAMPHVHDLLDEWRSTRWVVFVARLEVLAHAIVANDLPAVQTARFQLKSKLIDNRGDLALPLTQFGGVAGSGGVPRVWMVNPKSGDFVLVHATYKAGEQHTQGSIKDAARWTTEYLAQPHRAIPLLQPASRVVARVQDPTAAVFAWLDHHRTAKISAASTALGINPLQAEAGIRAWRDARGYGAWPRSPSQLPANWLPRELEQLREVIEGTD